MKIDCITLFDGENFIQTLKLCNKICSLKEKILYYSIRQIAKQYIAKNNNDEFSLYKFQTYFEEQLNLLFSNNIFVLKTELGIINKYLFQFEFFENKIKKHITLSIKPKQF